MKSHSDLSDEEYLRECTLRNLAFIEARGAFQKRWDSSNDLFGLPPPKAGLTVKELKSRGDKQKAYLAAVVSFLNDWPAVSPFDLIDAGDQPKQLGPKVRLAPYNPALWPKDGSILLQIHRTVTGKGIELPFQRIMEQLDPQVRVHQGECKYVRKRQRNGQSRKMMEVWGPANGWTLAREWIIVRVGPMATGKEARKGWERIKLSLPRRRQRKSQRSLKLAIYDMYSDNWRIPKIALATKRKRSTVYDLFDTVCKDIGIARVKGKPLVDPKFTLKEHIPTCRQCRTGPRLCRYAETGLGLASLNPMQSYMSLNEGVDYSVSGKHKHRPKIEY